MALVYYHRGNKLRPELNEFRLGIQKAKEAINNSIGGKFFFFFFFFFFLINLYIYFFVLISVLNLFKLGIKIKTK